MKRIAFPLVMVAGIALIVACGSDSTTPTPVSKIVTLKATMAGANESPAVTSPATGTFTATLDTSTNVFTFDVTYTGLVANSTAGHIHGPFVPGTAGTAVVILNFATLAGSTLTVGATSGTAHGQVTLNAATQISTTVNGDSLKKLILAGLTYANVHSTTNPGGEVRGQITIQ